MHGWPRSAALLSLLLTAAPSVAHADAVDDLAPGSWYAIPGTKMRDVCPPNETDYDWHFYCKGVMTAWSGGTLDTTRGRLVVWGGGHGDYKGNEVYTFDFGTLAWARVWGPSPLAQIGTIQGFEAYGDGNPGSRHSYAGLTYAPPPVDAMITMGGALWQNGAYALGTWSFGFAGNAWTRKTDGPNGQTYGDPSVYDPVTKHIFRRASGKMVEYDPAADQYADRATYEAWPSAPNVAAALDPDARLMVIVGSGRVDLYHLDTDQYELDVPVGGAGTKDLFGDGCPGIDFDPLQKRFVLWAGGQTVYTFDPVARTYAAHAGAGDDPGPITTSGGVFGRFRYVPSRNVFVAVDNVDQDVHVLRMAPGTGTPLPSLDGGTGGGGGQGGSTGLGGSGGQGGSTGLGGSGGTTGTTGSGGLGGAAGHASSGCACELGAAEETRAALWPLVALAAGALARRRRGA